VSSRTEWFRRTTWTAADKAEFTARLGRSRSSFHKAQYLRIQAVHLAQAEPPLYEPALELLDLMVRDFPDPSQLAAAHQQLASCLAALGRPSEALDVFRKALDAEGARPQVNAYLDFAELVLALGRADLYSEALGIVEKRIDREILPVGRYRGCAAAALICEKLEFHERARPFAIGALDAAAKSESPFRYHRTLGLVEGTDPGVHAQLQRIAGRAPP
jgi:tetratricopeptide (TPR) repeat protein